MKYRKSRRHKRRRYGKKRIKYKRRKGSYKLISRGGTRL